MVADHGAGWPTVGRPPVTRPLYIPEAVYIQASVRALHAERTTG
eukprot:CAMPEP_0175304464 /NCGR_PEP_ID=MMETSP0093-20121207/63243_1 /TAXON_ID=311494 /ORGANISM="Alexandrium monilatum, Strain CCMP3105" /LENGTH=43 /DNA_ID= /DNA_START= /DNA_END= /DNA_ORIENTATION=